MPKWTGYLDDDYDTTEDYQQVVRIPSKPKTFIKEVYVCSNAEAWAFFSGDTGRMTELSPAEVERMASEDAAVQHKTWRASLDKDTRKKLLESQFEWQVMFEDGNRDDSFFRSQEGMIWINT